MTRRRVIVTTSWDDGHILDLRVAEMLDQHGLTGTFYVAPRSIEMRAKDRLTSAQLRSIADRFEIGGHTLTHRRLPSLSVAEATDEIGQGKAEVEQTLGRAVTSFAYPGGRYDRRHLGLVRDAGFELARTVRRHVTEAAVDRFQVHTTVQAYRHWSDLGAVIRQSQFRPATAAGRFWSWDRLAAAAFDDVLQRGGVFHLWGHSWEIDERGDWGRLDAVLAYIAQRAGVSYVVNGALPLNTASAGGGL